MEGRGCELRGGAGRARGPDERDRVLQEVFGRDLQDAREPAQNVQGGRVASALELNHCHGVQLGALRQGDLGQRASLPARPDRPADGPAQTLERRGERAGGSGRRHGPETKPVPLRRQ
jgi:hypothetical protein